MQLTKQKTIPGLSEALVVVRTSASGLQLVSTHDKLTQQTLSLVTQGIANVVPSWPFANMIANWSKIPKTLPKGMIMAQFFELSTATMNTLLKGKNIETTRRHSERQCYKKGNALNGASLSQRQLFEVETALHQNDEQERVYMELSL